MNYYNAVYKIIQTIQPELFTDYGLIVPFGDIVIACKSRGLDNRDIVSAMLVKYEEEGLLKVVRAKENPDLIIGITSTYN